MRNIYITRNEAAELSGASTIAINKAVEQKAVKTGRARAGGRGTGRPASQLIDARDVGALCLFNTLSFALPIKDKRKVFAWLREAELDAELLLAEGIVVRKTERVDAAARRAVKYAELRDRFLEINPDVQGGEPVIRGTRVPIRGLAKQIEAGEAMSVLLEEYDSIDPEAFTFATLWARANPRRGRPSRARTPPAQTPEPEARAALLAKRRSDRSATGTTRRTS
jgi:uncharacterized protein (DUF433 family)